MWLSALLNHGFCGSTGLIPASSSPLGCYGALAGGDLDSGNPECLELFFCWGMCCAAGELCELACPFCGTTNTLDCFCEKEACVSVLPKGHDFVPSEHPAQGGTEESFQVYDEHWRKSPFNLGTCCSHRWTSPCLLQWAVATCCSCVAFSFPPPLKLLVPFSSEIFWCLLCVFVFTLTIKILSVAFFFF